MKVSFMRRIVLFCGLLLTLQIASSQSVQVSREDFDGNPNTGFTINGSGSTTWVVETNASISKTKYMRGQVPNLDGDSIMLTTPVYDFSTYDYVLLKFKHICKVSPKDEVKIEFKEDRFGALWEEVPGKAYIGNSSYDTLIGFSANTYDEWVASNDAFQPQDYMWKEAIFDLSNELSYAKGQIRFVIKKGAEAGTNMNYGWLIDDIEFRGSSPETVEYLPPVLSLLKYVYGSVYAKGPYTINAKIKSRTSASLEKPYLVYEYTVNNTTTKDSILMTPYKGDTLYSATIPQLPVDSKVSYSITAKDTLQNESVVLSGYTISMPNYGPIDIVQTDTIGDPLIGSQTSPAFIYMNQDPPVCNRILYHASEIGNVGRGKFIGSIDFYTNSTTVASRDIFIWMKETDDIEMPLGEMKPDSIGAQLVFSGNFTSNQYWNKVEFFVPYFLNPDKNLYIFL